MLCGSRERSERGPRRGWRRRARVRGTTASLALPCPPFRRFSGSLVPSTTYLLTVLTTERKESLLPWLALNSRSPLDKLLSTLARNPAECPVATTTSEHCTPRVSVMDEPRRRGLGEAGVNAR